MHHATRMIPLRHHPLAIAIAAIVPILGCSDSTSHPVASSGGTVTAGGASTVRTLNSSNSNGGSLAMASTSGGGGASSRTSTVDAGGHSQGGTSSSHDGNGGTTLVGTSSVAIGGSGIGGNANAAGSSAHVGSSSPSPNGGKSGTNPTGGVASGGTATISTVNGGTSAGGKPTAGASSGGSTVIGSSHSGKWQLMMLGDSITGTTCYPQLLSQTLIKAGHANFQMVGKQLNNQSCNGAPNVQTEGHGGYLVTYLETDSPAVSSKGTLTELKAWAAEKPEIVVMHYGTNDVWNDISASNVLTGYTNVLTQFRSQNPGVIFFVAQIIPMAPSSCSDCSNRVATLNSQIPAWASSNGTATSPIHVVDLATGFTPDTTNTQDGVHPTVTGAQKMADKMSAALGSADLGL